MLLTHTKTRIVNLVKELLTVYGALKLNILVECKYFKPLSEEFQDKAFNTNNVCVLQDTPVEKVLQNLIKRICSDEVNYEGGLYTALMVS